MRSIFLAKQFRTTYRVNGRGSAHIYRAILWTFIYSQLVISLWSNIITIITKEERGGRGGDARQSFFFLRNGC